MRSLPSANPQDLEPVVSILVQRQERTSVQMAGQVTSKRGPFSSSCRRAATPIGKSTMSTNSSAPHGHVQISVRSGHPSAVKLTHKINPAARSWEGVQKDKDVSPHILKVDSVVTSSIATCLNPTVLQDQTKSSPLLRSFSYCSYQMRSLCP